MLDRRSGRTAHCSLLGLGTQQALVQEQKAHRSHLQSGSPCLHTGKCWRSGDWAKGGRERSKVKLKLLILKDINGQGEGQRKNKDQQQNQALAHRLDRGRVLCVPDGTLCPGVIRRRRLGSR